LEVLVVGEGEVKAKGVGGLAGEVKEGTVVAVAPCLNDGTVAGDVNDGAVVAVAVAVAGEAEAEAEAEAGAGAGCGCTGKVGLPAGVTGEGEAGVCVGNVNFPSVAEGLAKRGAAEAGKGEAQEGEGVGGRGAGAGAGADEGFLVGPFLMGFLVGFAASTKDPPVSGCRACLLVLALHSVREVADTSSSVHVFFQGLFFLQGGTGGVIEKQFWVFQSNDDGVI
jgi:hypothetical protein